jgi:uncharacterized LabA/DUF88 family protein
MAFIDGTNLFHRLESHKWRLKPHGLWRLCWMGLRTQTELIRAYLYTSQPHYDRARGMHDAEFDRGVRLVLGDAIPTGDGNYREKGVDALLVADLVYHAAARNCDQALLVSVDTDFARALSRVEDFGCRTMVMGVGVEEVPARLIAAADVDIIPLENGLRDAGVIH